MQTSNSETRELGHHATYLVPAVILVSSVPSNEPPVDAKLLHECQATEEWTFCHMYPVSTATPPNLPRSCLQSPTIAHLAQQYVLINIPALIFRAWVEPMEKYLQAQGHTLPLALSTGLALIVHIPFSYCLIFTFGFGFYGAAWAYVLSQSVQLLFLTGWILTTRVYKKTWGGWTMAAFHGWVPYLALAIPSASMIW